MKPKVKLFDRAAVFKLIRKNLYGFTQEDMAQTFGVTTNTIARLERGEAKLNGHWFKTVENVLLQDHKDEQVNYFLRLWRLSE